MQNIKNGSEFDEKTLKNAYTENDKLLINNIENTGTNTNNSNILNSDKSLINKETENLKNNTSGTAPLNNATSPKQENNTNVLYKNNGLWTDNENSIKTGMQNNEIVHKIEESNTNISLSDIKDKNILNNINEYLKNNKNNLSSDDVAVIKKSAVMADNIKSDIEDTNDILDIVQQSSNAIKLDDILSSSTPAKQAVKNLDEMYNNSVLDSSLVSQAQNDMVGKIQAQNDMVGKIQAQNDNVVKIQTQNDKVEAVNNNNFPDVIDYNNLSNGKNTSKTTKQLDSKTSNSIISNVKNYVKNTVSYKSRLNNHYDYMKNREQMFKDINNGYNEIINIFHSLNELSTTSRKQLHEYLTNDNKNVPVEIMKLGNTFRTELNKMGMQAVENGLLSRAAFDEWKNIYLYRTYDKSLKNSIKNALSKISNKSILKDKTIQAELKRLNPTGVYNKLIEKGENKETASIISRRIKELLSARGEFYTGTETDYKILLENGKIGRLSDGKIAAFKNDDGTYTFRRDYTKSERQAMGEITDGALTIARTMQKLNDMINVGKFLKYIENNIADKSSSKNLVELKGSQFGALNGHKLPKDIANDLESISNSLFGYNNDIINLYQKYLRVWKKAVSIYNPGTHTSNVMSNIFLMTMGGFPAHKTIPFILKGSATLKGYANYKLLNSKYMAGTITDAELKTLEKLHNNKNIQTAKLADSAGIFSSNRFNEVMQSSQDINNNLVTGQAGFIKRNYNKLLSKFENAFQIEDNAAKYTMFDYLINDKKMLVDEAVAEINKIVPDYNAPMHKSIRALRDTGLVPFISWTYYTLPTILKQLNPVGKNNVGKGLNKYNAFNMLKILGTLSIADYILTSNTSIYDEQPPIFNNKRMPVYEDYNGNVTTLKIDKWLPHLSIFDPSEFFLSQAGSGIPQKLITNILLDSDPYFRNQITWNKGIHGALDRAEYYIENYAPVPRFIFNMADVLKTSIIDEDTRRKSPFLNPRTPLESFLTSLGFNTLSYNKDRYNAYLDNKYR